MPVALMDQDGRVFYLYVMDTGVEALCSRSLIHHLTRLRVAEVGREGPFLVGTAPTKTPLSEVCPRAFQ